MGDGGRALADLALELSHWAATTRVNVPARRKRQIELVCKAVLEGAMALELYKRLPDDPDAR